MHSTLLASSGGFIHQSQMCGRRPAAGPGPRGPGGPRLGRPPAGGAGGLADPSEDHRRTRPTPRSRPGRRGRRPRYRSVRPAKSSSRPCTAAGADRITTVDAGDRPPAAALTVYLGGPGENPRHRPDAETARRRLPDRSRLRRLRPGLRPQPGPGPPRPLRRRHDRHLLRGADPAPTPRRHSTSCPTSTVRDWPHRRAPRSHRGLLRRALDARRTPRPAGLLRPDEAERLRLLAQGRPLPARAAGATSTRPRSSPSSRNWSTGPTANHVRFTYALSPGLSVCYSSAADDQGAGRPSSSRCTPSASAPSRYRWTTSATPTWNCPADEQKFGTGGGAAGAAQAYLLNPVAADFIDDAPRTSSRWRWCRPSTPTSPTRRTRRRCGSSSIRRSSSSGPASASSHRRSPPTRPTQAREVFGHPILVWDNYPVNDYVTSRLLLGPYTGREPGVAERSSPASPPTR